MNQQKKICFGFHKGSGGGNQNGIGEYYRALNAAGIPIFDMSADSFPFEAQQIALANPGIRHTVVFRRSAGHEGTKPPSGNPDIPQYNLSPAASSANHWKWHWNHRPTEMHPDTWMIITNEPGSRLEFDEKADALAVPLYGVREFYTRVTPEGQTKYGVTNAGWLAAYEVENARSALQVGQRYAALGWASGNPEPEDWEHPESLKMLRFYADNPDRLAIALHEYSWKSDDIWFGNGRLVGRFIDIYKACCKHGIPYPTILITEWGWTYENVPAPTAAMSDIKSVAEYYAQFPEIRGAAIWYLGPEFGGIADKAQKLIAPLTSLILNTPLTVTELYPGLGDCAVETVGAGVPREQYARTVYVLPQKASVDRFLEVAAEAYAKKRTVGFSYDDAGIGALADKTAVLWDIPQANQQLLFDWYANHYAGTKVTFHPDVSVPAAPFPANDGTPREQYARTYHVAPQNATMAQWLSICRAAAAGLNTVGFSYDDAGIGDLERKTAVLWDIPETSKQTFINWYAEHYPGTTVQFQASLSAPAIELIYRPCDTDRITQQFGANPANYARFSLPGHEGIDYGVAQGWPYYAVAGGTVVHASDRRWSNAASISDYGWHVVIDHGSYCTVYAHVAAPLPVQVGQQVKAGDKVGVSGNTGNSTGYHLHFSLLDKTGEIDAANGYPNWKHGRPVNPAPFLVGLQPPPKPTGNARLGLHASADPGDLYGRTAEVNEFKELAAVANGRSVVKILSAHSVTAISQLVTAVPNAHWIVRAFMDFGDRTITPGQFFNDTISDTRRTVDALVNRGIPAAHITIELHNEPNLKQEGWGKSWANGTEFGNWILDVMLSYRMALPTVRYMYPGLSPGGDEAGVRTNSTRFLNDCATAISGFDALAAHCYWSNGWQMVTALGWLDAHQKYGKPVWVTEASRNDRPQAVPVAQYAAEYVAFWQECRKRPEVQGVTYFVASASNGYFAPECWIVSNKSRGIASEMKRLAIK